MSKAQDRPSKRCRCDAERAFTDNRPGTHRDDDGNFIGPNCYTKLLIDRFLNRPKGD